MKFPLLALPLTLAFSTMAHAQWRTTTYNLVPGWNSIYLNGDATYQTPDQHFGSLTDVQEVWRWNPNPAQVEFTSSPSDPTPGTAEWSVWRRDQPAVSDLSLLTGQTAYLVKLRDGAPATSLSLKQRVQPPALNWLRSGANFLGFPSKNNAGVFPTLANYFATFSTATASKIYRYNGGPLDANNPVRLFSANTDRLDPKQAYWFEAKTVSDFVGPLGLELSDPSGLNFGTVGSSVTLTIRNRTAVTQTLTFAPTNSESAPAGQPAIAGSVALTRRTFNAAAAQYDDAALSAPFTATVAANGTLSLIFGVDRTAMTGAPGSLFASLLRITDAANLMDIYLPATAGATSMAGLWVGDAELTNVESKTPGYTGTQTSSSFPLRYLIHVSDNGTATLLSQVYLGTLAAAPNDRGVATTEAALKQDELSSAIRLTAAHLPLDRAILRSSGGLGAGNILTATISLPYNDPTSPFVHQYHPDHNNKDERLNPVGQGVESWTVNRQVTFTFAATAPAGLSAGWGSKVLAGTYGERFTGVPGPDGETGGIYKKPITASGTFVLRRVSESGTLVTTP